MRFRIISQMAVFFLTGCLLLGASGCGDAKSDPVLQGTPGSSGTNVLMKDGEPDSLAEPQIEPVFIDGWKVYEPEDPETYGVQDRAYAALHRAEEKLEEKVRYEEVALLATQIVSGTNYCIFCRTNWEGFLSYMLTYVYEDNSGGADILSTQNFFSDGILEGFEINSKAMELMDNEEVAAAFLRALENSGEDYLSYTGLGYMGRYVDENGETSGYMVFCKIRDTDPESKKPLYFGSVLIEGIQEDDPRLGAISQAPVGV